MKHETTDAIHVSQMSYGYNPGKLILDGINFAVADNDFTAILGQNGSGKTTLFKNISGLLRPLQGSIFVRGKNTAEMDVAEIAQELGYAMQDPDNQLFEQTVFDEVAFALKQHGRSLTKKEIHEKVDEALITVGLWEKKHIFPPKLPRADRFKTVLASILAMGPKIIFLDEPSAGQDSRGCRMIMDITAQLHQNGYTIVLITHNIAIAAEYAKRIIVMKNANIYMDGIPSEIFTQTEKLAAAGILPPQITRLSQALHKHIPLEKDALVPKELAAMLAAMLID